MDISSIDPNITQEVSPMLTKEEHILIGKRIVAGEITVHDAEKKYHIPRSSVQLYATDYRKANGPPLQKYRLLLPER